MFFLFHASNPPHRRVADEATLNFALFTYYAMLSQMALISQLLPYIQVILAVLLTVGILLQQTAAGLGGALGDNFSSGFHTRRGFEKYIFNATVVIAIAFAISAFLALIIK
jgi:preprotein translocase subunit SecG